MTNCRHRNGKWSNSCGSSVTDPGTALPSSCILEHSPLAQPRFWKYIIIYLLHVLNGFFAVESSIRRQICSSLSCIKWLSLDPTFRFNHDCIFIFYSTMKQSFLFNCHLQFLSPSFYASVSSSIKCEKNHKSYFLGQLWKFKRVRKSAQPFIHYVSVYVQGLGDSFTATKWSANME